MMALIGMATGCKSSKSTTKTKEKTEQKTDKQEPTMPQGRLMEVDYRFQGMNMMAVNHPRLKRTDTGATLTVKIMGRGDVELQVSDTLLDAARTIIEEERMYAYDSYYSLPPEIADKLLDGFSWSFTAVFEGKQCISSDGKHVEPAGDGLQRLNKLLVDEAMARLKEQGVDVRDY